MGGHNPACLSWPHLHGKACHETFHCLLTSGPVVVVYYIPCNGSSSLPILKIVLPSVASLPILPCDRELVLRTAQTHTDGLWHVAHVAVTTRCSHAYWEFLGTCYMQGTARAFARGHPSLRWSVLTSVSQIWRFSTARQKQFVSWKIIDILRKYQKKNTVLLSVPEGHFVNLRKNICISFNLVS